MWKPIHVQGMSPEIYDIPLKVNVSDDNVMVFIQMEVTEQTKTANYTLQVKTWQALVSIG
jgi:hypothetical protein